MLSIEEQALDSALEPTAAVFVDAFANYGSVLVDDGRVVFLSNRGSVPSLYLGDASSPGSPARKLDTPDDRLISLALLPDQRAAIFTSDLHSDGNFRIFRTELDGHDLKNLTAGEALHRDAPAVARETSGLFAYSAHASTEQSARVFVQDARGGEPKQVYLDQQGGFVDDISGDGTHILFRRELSDNEQIVFEIEVASGRAARLYPPEGSVVHVGSAAYSADGTRALLVSEGKDRPPRLIALDARTGRETARYEEQIVKTGSIDSFSVSPAGDRVAIVIDAGNHSVLRLLDAHTLALVRTIDIGIAAVALGRFRSDGRSFSVTLAGTDGPREISSIDVGTGTVTALRNDARPGLANVPHPKTSIVDIRSFDGTVIPTNLYLPADRPGKRPTFVLIHGGPSASAYLRWTPTVAFFTAMGFAVVEPNVRGSTGFGMAFQEADDRQKRGDALEDVEAVNVWARQQTWCDSERIVIGGVSYGGYMTLLALGRQPALWRAGISASGMSDLRTMEKLEDQVVRMYDETEFGALGKEDDLLWTWSPLKYVDRIAVPLFVYQGAHDPISPQNEADQIVRAVRRRNLPVEYMLLPDEGHGITRRENMVHYLARTYRFLAHHLHLPR